MSPRSDQASPTPGGRPSPSGTPRETVRSATSRQVRGLVRVLARTGTDGSGEAGTGMVLTSGGEVLTNNHVVEGALSVEVTVVATGRTYPARVAGRDGRRDVAVLRLTGVTGLETVTLAPRDAAVGDAVTVVGDAAGRRPALTAASGTVVALDQTLVTQRRGSQRPERLTGLVLSTTDVVPGESGGPTYDVDGRVVAMTTASVRGDGGLYGVAVPVGTLRTVVRALGG